jgi:leader peptidase (prepilin peptidase)/N-methyltransferase
MSLLPAIVLLTVLAIASVTDLKARIVPNELTYTAALAGLSIAGVSSLAALGVSILAGLALAAPLFVVSVLRPEGMGMGDVKLVAVLGIFMGWQAWPALLSGLALAAMSGALIAVSRGMPASAVALPLAPFLALGTAGIVAFAL